MLELLTGAGLALSAGLNAYIPLIALGLLARFSPLVDLPAGWDWLTQPWVLGVLGALVVVEFVADKVPSVDHLNDIAQTVVRPAAGGVAFAAGSASVTPAVAAPGDFYTSSALVPFLLGAALALLVHLAKAATRPVVNLYTAGTGAPVISVVEDIISVTLALLAILVPVLVVVFVATLVVVTVGAVRRRRRLRRPHATPTAGT